MLTSNIAKYQRLTARAAKLEKQIAKNLAATLAGLPKQYGFDSIDDFIHAVRQAATKRPTKRARISDAKRRSVLKRLAAKMSAISIAKALGISVPSVYVIKAKGTKAA